MNVKNIVLNCKIAPTVTAILMICVFVVCGCATSRPDDQKVQYKPQTEEEIREAQIHPRGLPSQPLVDAVHRDIESRASQYQATRNELGRPEVHYAKQRGLGEFFANVELIPWRGADNTFRGYEIVSMSPFSQQVCDRFEEAPRMNDVLVSVNGKKLKTPEDFYSVWEGLDRADSVDFTLLRWGAPEEKGTTEPETVKIQWPIR